MGLEQWISAAAAAFFVALGALAVARADRSPLAPPMAVLAAVLFAYTALEVVDHFTDAPLFHWLDGAAASLVGPAALHLVGAFLGERRRLRVALGVATLYFVGLAIACVLPIVVPALAAFPNGPTWSLLMLLGIAPTFGYATYLLISHARRSGADERGRAQLLGLALLLGVGSASSDLMAIASDMPVRVSSVGLMASAAILTALSLRARVVEGAVGIFAANAVALAGLAAIAQLVVLAWVGDQTLLAMVGAIAVTLAVMAALRPLAAAAAEERARATHLATLGRFTAQMAHDIKNPLAAIKGAAQFLAEEVRQGRSIDAQTAFVDLVLEQAERVGRVVERYQRIGRVEAIRARQDVGALVAEVLDAQRASAGPRLTLRADADVGGAEIDRDLVAGALENLVRNAREALAEQGTIVVRARREEAAIVLAVSDDGPGMDARTRERALDDFFTTKATGSGLGLAFVARVAEAHGGRARIESAEGRGTTVELRLALPLQIAADDARDRPSRDAESGPTR